MAVARFREANPDTYLALNASPETLPSCGELFHDSDPPQAVIEITEHAAIDNYGALAPVLDALRQDGLRIAVDDAGAGFASLRHALHLSPDFIKLDVSLTRGIDTDPRRRALAAGLIGFANELGAEIIAEGIETKAELTALQELRVSYGQGYYLAKPAPLPAG
jgi:EAL domain-containing protein (putative c-di-GMP-specific phosphodiesterase class I)